MADLTNHNTKDKHTAAYWAKVHKVTTYLLENPEYYQKNRYQALVEWVKKELGVEVRQAKRYITDAKKEVSGVHKLKTKQAVELTIVQYKKILTDCYNSATGKDKHRYLKLALETLKEQNQLLNLYPEKKIQAEVNHSGSISNPLVDKLAQLPLEELKKIAFGEDGE